MERKEHKLKKTVVGILGIFIGAVTGGAVVGKLSEKKVTQKEEKVDKFKSYYEMLNQWLIIKQEGKSLEQYFIDNGYKTVAIYGMGEMGNRLYTELQSGKVEIRYAVDENADGIYSDLEILSREDEFKEVDVMVVTATFAFDEIVEELRKKVDCPIVSLDDVVYDM